ncbi:hypothetical protein A3J90_01560 [candidate division WOR-1 bacterium RIFOXYC2_FULL_37_10]|uniref:Uncharacterized protein n=1 Tax=candidate division WOR-1 bacterium RIFOXYB2_FULL_37_13 TaxID=1802579 RepID=A0A1F4SPL7_UNCSA|nr:MAG: hypothetical protein A2246_05800 [candidate division WOR-1 bacterium RIFOXYA2_FULL_37_7]OGC22359.1 MAG: hypothetical protein A2310_01670 [candidate division WOR-1 bacterium RIFOXYB2_FULL_37_13]OGC35797.1 MAG: hypothetical protein A3J90_01560 [candidate division WOR-1 bacterium RIFOXYC2_FULL_37_10]
MTINPTSGAKTRAETVGGPSLRVKIPLWRNMLAMCKMAKPSDIFPLDDVQQEGMLPQLKSDCRALKLEYHPDRIEGEGEFVATLKELGGQICGEIDRLYGLRKAEIEKKLEPAGSPHQAQAPRRGDQGKKLVRDYQKPPSWTEEEWQTLLKAHPLLETSSPLSDEKFSQVIERLKPRKLQDCPKPPNWENWEWTKFINEHKDWYFSHGKPWDNDAFWNNIEANRPMPTKRALHFFNLPDGVEKWEWQDILERNPHTEFPVEPFNKDKFIAWVESQRPYPYEKNAITSDKMYELERRQVSDLDYSGRKELLFDRKCSKHKKERNGSPAVLWIPKENIAELITKHITAEQQDALFNLLGLEKPTPAWYELLQPEWKTVYTAMMLAKEGKHPDISLSPLYSYGNSKYENCPSVSWGYRCDACFEGTNIVWKFQRKIEQSGAYTQPPFLVTSPALVEHSFGNHGSLAVFEIDMPGYSWYPSRPDVYGAEVDKSAILVFFGGKKNDAKIINPMLKKRLIK